MSAVRQVHWIKIPNDDGSPPKDRVVVVTRTEPDYVLVVYGQSSPNLAMMNVEAEVGSDLGNVANLKQTTYFREENVLMVERARFVHGSLRGKCPKDTFNDLQDLVDTANRNGRIRQTPAVAAALQAREAQAREALARADGTRARTAVEPARDAPASGVAPAAAATESAPETKSNA